MNKAFIQLSLLLFCVFSFQGNLISQVVYSAEDLRIALDEFNIVSPVEKLYIHTDRKYYSAGEVIWFQTYMVAGSGNIPSPLSTVVYVELYDESGVLIDKKKVFSDLGFGNGNLDLKENLPAGSYLIKGYSNWMKNNDQSFFFEKEIVVIDKFWNSSDSVSDEVDLQFFPEGGYLVEGVRSRVGFKAIDSRGRGLSFTGKIVNQKGDEITKITSEHRGMGSFSFTPAPNDTYHALVDGNEKVYDFPKVEDRGFVLWVDNLSTKLRITVRGAGLDKTQKYSMIIHTRGEVVYAFEPNLNFDPTIIELPLEYFTTGLAHISLLDANAQVLSNRLIFVTKESSELSVSGIKDEYTKRSKVQAEIKLVDKQGDPLRGVFSVSILDLDQTFDREPNRTIVSDLLLTSDLKGFVEDPVYYFDSKNEKAKNHLDLLLLTQGWSRFTWNEVIDKSRQEPIFKMEKGLEIDGVVKRLGGNKIEPEAIVTFLNRNITPPLLTEIKSDENGYFNLTGLQYFEDHEIVLQATDKKKRASVRLEVDSTSKEKAELPVSLDFLKTFDLEGDRINRFSEDANYRKQVNATYDFDSTNFRDLGDFVIEGKRGEQVKGNENSVYGASDYTLSFNQAGNAAYYNPFQALQGRIPGVKVALTGSSVSISIRNSVGSGFQDLPPLILLDDSPSRIEDISALPATIFDRVEVYKGPSAAVFGAQGGAGVLAFYTKTGAEVVAMGGGESKGIYALKLKNGYSRPRVFYSPKYEVALPEHAKPDKRVVLYWEPMILTDENGNAKIQFWNSDESSEFLIDLQGLTLSGEPINFSKTYKVEEKE
jgi:hypothetical protein